jgi:hypothetical protein
MRIVIDTIDTEGGCRALIVEPIDCDGIVLIVRRNARDIRIPLSAIADWSPVDGEEGSLPLDSWIKRRHDVVCF